MISSLIAESLLEALHKDMNRRIIAGLFLCGFQASPVSLQAADIKPPFATRQPDTKMASKPCPPLTNPVVSFDLQSKYGQSGSRRDRIDEEAEAAFEAAMQPIKEFMGDVVKAANDYHRTGRRSAAECSLAHLRHWAIGDALREPESHTSHFKLATTLTGLSSAFMQTEPALPAGSADAKLIKEWLAKRANQLRLYFDTLKAPRSSRNNHRAWAGLAVASAGVVANDRKLLDWGMDSYRLVICQATADGALPLEIERGAKAREYHFYALAALTPLAEIGQKNGRSSYGECAGALHRVAAYTLQSIANPAIMAAAAKAAQSGGTKSPSSSKLTFLEPYTARFPDRMTPFKGLLANQPFGLTDLGGNQTILYQSR